jgi:hypothetical protein
MEDFDRYVIKVYVEDLLIGYVKKLGRIKDGKRSFSITKKINSAIYYQNIIACDIAKNTLEIPYDMKSINNSKYTFEIYKINIKDIRISKLKKLKKLKKIKKDE